MVKIFKAGHHEGGGAHGVAKVVHLLSPGFVKHMGQHRRQVVPLMFLIFVYLDQAFFL